MVTLVVVPPDSLRSCSRMDTGTAHLIAAGTLTRKRRTVILALSLEKVQPNPDQPRRHFDEEALSELADSIRERGVLQPVIVRRRDDGNYDLVAGERRYRASRIAGLTSIPALVRDDDPLAIAMIENLQREDLTPLEEALGIAALIREHGYTHVDVAAILHKSRPHVTNTLALTKLPARIQEDYSQNPDIPRDILISVARQPDESAMLELWQRVRAEPVSVRMFRKGQAATLGDAKPTVRRAILAARRLGRRLDGLSEPIDADEQASLQRSLRRLRKKIDTFL